MLDGSKIINGSWATTWLNDEEVMEAISLEATIDINKEAVTIAGRLATAHKMTGWEGKGTLKVNHVTSRFWVTVSANLKAGKTTSCTIVSKLADPDSYGAERVALKNVIFDNLTLMNFENKKQGEYDIPFTFEDYELLDQIDPASVS